MLPRFRRALRVVSPLIECRRGSLARVLLFSADTAMTEGKGDGAELSLVSDGRRA